MRWRGMTGRGRDKPANPLFPCPIRDIGDARFDGVVEPAQPLAV